MIIASAFSLMERNLLGIGAWKQKSNVATNMIVIREYYHAMTVR